MRINYDSGGQNKTEVYHEISVLGTPCLEDKSPMVRFPDRKQY